MASHSMSVPDLELVLKRVVTKCCDVAGRIAASETDFPIDVKVGLSMEVRRWEAIGAIIDKWPGRLCPNDFVILFKMMSECLELLHAFASRQSDTADTAYGTLTETDLEGSIVEVFESSEVVIVELWVKAYAHVTSAAWSKFGVQKVVASIKAWGTLLDGFCSLIFPREILGHEDDVLLLNANLPQTAFTAQVRLARMSLRVHTKLVNLSRLEQTEFIVEEYQLNLPRHGHVPVPWV
jgi:hypothetical protein